jgi:hypothetical protein
MVFQDAPEGATRITTQNLYTMPFNVFVESNTRRKR